MIFESTNTVSSSVTRYRRTVRPRVGSLSDEGIKNPQTTVVVIEEIDTDNWGIGGDSVTERRKS